MSARFVRLAEQQRAPLRLTIDGLAVAALQGDTVMVAMLTAIDHLRSAEFGDGERAGFCLMGACQDCWVWTRGGARLRACTTLATDGMDLCTQSPGAEWSTRA